MRFLHSICIACLLALTACQSNSSRSCESQVFRHFDHLSDQQIQVEIDRLLQRRITAQQYLHANTPYQRYRYINGVDQVEARRGTLDMEVYDDDYYKSLISDIDSELRRYVAENDRRMKAKQEALIDPSGD
jgi:hypothetical protein